MRLFDFIKSLPSEELEAYATRCGTTKSYISIHILHARKEPRKQLREALARESLGNVSLQEVLEHFGMGAVSAA